MSQNCLENTDQGGPGPSTYHLKPTIGMPKTTDPTLWQSPAYSLRPRTNIQTNSPGPGPTYKFDQITRYGHDTNGKIIFGCRTPYSKRSNTIGPGPAGYLPCYPNLLHSPTPKFSSSPKELRIFITPSPNAYTLRKTAEVSSIKSKRKGYTIQSRTRYPLGESETPSPGPAAYGLPKVDVYKNHAPAVSLSARARGPIVQARGPGPQTYYVTGCARACATKFSFGVKHSPKCPPYVIPDDNRSP